MTLSTVRNFRTEFLNSIFRESRDSFIVGLTFFLQSVSYRYPICSLSNFIFQTKAPKSSNCLVSNTVGNVWVCQNWRRECHPKECCWCGFLREIIEDRWHANCENAEAISGAAWVAIWLLCVKIGTKIRKKNIKLWIRKIKI